MTQACPINTPHYKGKVPGFREACHVCGGTQMTGCLLANGNSTVVPRERAKEHLMEWVHQVLTDYEVSEEAFKNDPELAQSADAVLDALNIPE